jgi:serine protease AprX
VMSIGSGTTAGSLSSFSSRGAAGYGPFYPTLIAPGENVVSTRATGINTVGVSGLAGTLNSPATDAQTIPPAYIARYTTASGTSFAAPHVAGTVALMLQANPSLAPDDVKRILQETATPMLGYSRYEVGAGYLNTYAAVRKAIFATPFGGFRASLSNPGITLSRDALAEFGGQVAPGATYTTTFDLPADTLFATVQVGWVQSAGVKNFLDVLLQGPGAYITSEPAIGIGGPSLQQTGVTVTNPNPGRWTIKVTNTNDALRGSVQQFAGAIEVFRSNFDSITGINTLSLSGQQAARRALRLGLMTTVGSDFAGSAQATRLDVARALMLGAGAHVPQYLPYSPTFSDVTADADAIFVESVVHSPHGNLMGATGSAFNPQASIDRLTVAVAVVKALGLDAEAQAAGSTNPGYTDWSAIPEWARGYVAVVAARNLMSADASGRFRPFDSITRVELAATAVALQQAAR